MKKIISEVKNFLFVSVFAYLAGWIAIFSLDITNRIAIKDCPDFVEGCFVGGVIMIFIFWVLYLMGKFE